MAMGAFVWGVILVLFVGAVPSFRSAEPAPSDEGSLSASLYGRVTVSADPPSPPVTLSPYARRREEPPQEPGAPGGSEDAFVYLEPLTREAPPAGAEPARILQGDRTIIPHVSVAQVGQVVQFPNEDDIFHNLFSLSPGNRFSLGRYGPGVTETNVFRTPGTVRLFCDIHAEMAGVILVVRTPWVARVGADGGYRLDALPAGTYRAIAWHPTSRPDTIVITLGAGAQSTHDFRLRPAR